MDVAASAQHVFEQIILIILRKKLEKKKYKNLCISQEDVHLIPY